MPRFFLALVGFLMLALLATCAGLEEAAVEIVDPDPITMTLNMGCDTNIGTGQGFSDWELTVDPDDIVSDQRFTADLKGKVKFDEADIGTAQTLIVGGFKWALIIDLQATVHVRKGATGDDVVLIPEADAIPYLCAVGKTPCDPENDLPGTPGIRGNTDCAPQGETNPCGLFVPIPTSDDCAPSGLCEELGWTDQCEANGFCVSGPVVIPLEKALQAYEADRSGNVLFGFDDQHAEILQEGGCNDGTWNSREPRFADDLGPTGVRMMIKSVEVAVECLMGVNGRGPDGVDSCDPFVAPTPDSRLISFPIQSR